MDKIVSALCTATGIMEARAEIYKENGNYKEAKDLYRDLIYIHKEKPLAMSKRLVETYKEILQEIQQKEMMLSV